MVDIPLSAGPNAIVKSLRSQYSRADVFAIGQQLSQSAGSLPPLVYAIPTYQKMAKQLVALSNGWLELGEEVRKTQKDGKRWQAFTTSVRNRRVIVIGGTRTPQELNELYLMSYNAAHWRAHQVTMVVAYHGDARQERAKLEGESIDGLYTSMQLANIPRTNGGNEVLLVDIHSDTVIGFFQGKEVRCTNIEVLPDLMSKIREEHYAGKKVVLVAPDAGRGKVVTDAAKIMDLLFAIANKHRDGSGHTETLGLIGRVTGLHAIVSDDIIATGGTTIGTGAILNKKGVRDAVAAATHCTIPHPKYIQALKDCGYFSAIYFTDSTPLAVKYARMFPDFVHAVPMAPLLLKHVLD